MNIIHYQMVRQYKISLFPILPYWTAFPMMLLLQSTLIIILLITETATGFGVTIIKSRAPSLSLSTSTAGRKSHLLSNRNGNSCNQAYPSKIEEWENQHVESWLSDLGFGRYAQGFADDARGIGVDGDRLVFLGTEDQLDHIEWQMNLLGVNNDLDQWLLGDSIRQLVAASEITNTLLESLSSNIPLENRDWRSDIKNEKHGDFNDYQI